MKFVQNTSLCGIVRTMNTQVEAIKDRIAALAMVERGSRSRETIIEGADLNLSTYSDFETRKRWPRAINLRRIEAALDWANGAIDEAVASGMVPAMITLAHMRGEDDFVDHRPALSEYTSWELAAELVRRTELVQSNEVVLDEALDASLDEEVPKVRARRSRVRREPIR